MKRADQSREPYSVAQEHQSDVTVSRREIVSLLGSGVIFSGLSACSSQTTREAPLVQLHDELYYSSTVTLAHAIRMKQVSSEEVVKACLDRVEEVNPKLNAVVQLVVEDALAKAREADAGVARGEFKGPLHGVPMTIKDSLDTAGVISTGGTKGRSAFIPETDATVVSRLKNAGAILIGKTNTPEVTLSFETDNLIYGRTNNPYDVNRTSGGSSGGAAAIVAAGGAPFDIGSDFGGSIRLPAHFCGVAGIKPSAGRVPRTGHIYPFGGMLDSFQQIGPLARYVDDLALLLPIFAGPDWIDPAITPMPLGSPKDVDLAKLRVSFHTDNGVKTPTVQTVEVIRAAAKALSDENILVEEARPDGIEESMELFLLYRADGGTAVRRLLKEAGTTEHTLQRITEWSPLSAQELDTLVNRWYAFRSSMHSFLQNYDVILSPVNADPALLHGSTRSAESLPAFSYTFTYNLTGWPGTVVRGGTSPEGLPIGLQVIAAPGREDVTLAVAKRLETALGGFQPPSV
ncbi:amidase [Acidobacteria bacterium AH-259-D05]|nr:amidase [Acidobacteria bacterium AH-259-D05]